MMAIQKKSLDHVIALLDSTDRYKIFGDVHRALNTLGIDKEQFKTILEVLDKAKDIEYDKIRDAKSWLKTLQSDLK